MREEIASLVYPVIGHGLAVKERLARGETLSLDSEQSALAGLLLTDMEARRWTDYGGERLASDSHKPPVPGDVPEADEFLGVRYALVCWLDEIFVLDSPWELQWNEQKLEAALYGTNDRAWKFWDQARRAESRPGTDALEVFFLCVMLGFRGAYREEPARLREWLEATRARVERGRQVTWTPPPELDPPANAPPLRGQESMQSMLLFCGVTILLLIPVITFLVVVRLR